MQNNHYTDPTDPSDRLLAGLNEHQHEAVTMPDDDVIILAGAGSGKTRVLTSRIAWLVREGRADTKEVLAVTFTNKAAKEMKDRLSQLVDAPINKMWIGTFHGLCHRMLRENAKIAGLPAGFSIMDEDEQLGMIKRMIKEIPEAPQDINPKQVQTFINKHKENAVRASRLVPNSLFDDFAVPFYASYEARCARQGTIDFTELMLRTSEMLQTNQEFLDRYQNRFSHILVDEFQDTNITQYEWLKNLRGDRASIFAVGDDDQSIYGFRGSNPQNMTDFVQEIAKGKVVRLEQNYRSTGSILAAANALIDKNSGRLGKNLWTDAGQGPRMRVMSFARDIEEAEQVGIEIKNWLNNGSDPSQVAILFRSNNQSGAYEKALMSRGVPYVIYGGTRFFDRMEIKNVLAYLRLTVNFSDDNAFRRVVNFPSRKLGDVTLDKVSDIAAEQGGIPLMMAAADHYNGKGKDKLDDFVRIIVDLFQEASQKPLAAFIETAIEVTGIKEAYQKNKEDEDRLSNLGELLSAARRFCEETEIPSAAHLPAIEILGEFLASASLQSALDAGTESEEVKSRKNVNAVTLMTVHSAKGLEFDNVVIGGAEEDLFPNKKSIDEGNEEEERRLMYVALTRARKNLLVTSAKYRYVYGKKEEHEPSRFLAEIPVNLKDQHRLPSPFWKQTADGKPMEWVKKEQGGSSYKKTEDIFHAPPPKAPESSVKPENNQPAVHAPLIQDAAKSLAQTPVAASQKVTPAESIAEAEPSIEPQSASKRIVFRRPGG